MFAQMDCKCKSTAIVQMQMEFSAPFVGWKYCWLICYEKKILFVGWKSTAYKPSEHGVFQPWVVHCIALVLHWLPLAALVVYCATYWYVVKHVIWIMILTCAAASVMILICNHHFGLSSRFPTVSVIFPPIFVRFRTPVFSAPAPNPSLSDPDPVSDDEM